MLEQVTQMYTSFLEFAKANQIVAGAISLWGLAVLTFFCKTIPQKVVSFIYTQCTTNLVLNNYDNIYHEFLHWVSENKMHSFVRNLNFNNKGRWSEGIPMISIGYGRTIFIFKSRLFILNRWKEEASQTTQVKETIKITLIGRSHDIFSKLFNIIKKENEQEHLLKIHTWSDGWVQSDHQHKRSLDTVIIDKQIKRDLINSIDNFINDKEWYFKHGIPWRFGIFFDGPSGTGKTSLIKAVSSYYDKHLYIINLARMSDETLERALSCVPYDAIVAIEDIDTSNLGKRDLEFRNNTITGMENTESGPITSTLRSSNSEVCSTLSLGGVLNAIDGISSSEGRILIATSNDKDSLDGALLREGRFDFKRHIGYMTDDTMREYMSRFYEQDFTDYKVKKDIPPCKVQKLVFENRHNPNNVLKEICNV